MANPNRGELAFTAGGRPYVLQYTHNALCELEQKCGRGIVDIFAEFQDWGTDPKKVTLSLLRDLLWAGLLRHQPQIKIEEVGDIFDGLGGMREVLALVAEGVSNAFTVPEAETKGPRPPTPGNGTGTNSSLSTLASATTQRSSGTSPPGN